MSKKAKKKGKKGVDPMLKKIALNSEELAIFENTGEHVTVYRLLKKV